MPPRHISPQSFDDILSELGNDPAIPDPHGIRKTSSPPRVDMAEQSKPPLSSFPTKSFDLKGLTFSPLWLFAVIALLFGGGFFFYFGANKSEAELEIDSLQNQILALKDDLEHSQSEWQSERDDLNDSIDEIEVSIYSLEIKPPTKLTQNQPIAIPYEPELRRWRYLGVASMGAGEQAFFHTSKSTRMVRKEDLVLGEWRLTQAEKDLAILTHPKGKSITFKSTQSE